jgi:hypothetical protein
MSRLRRSLRYVTSGAKFGTWAARAACPLLRQPHHREVGDEAGRPASLVAFDQPEGDVTGPLTDPEAPHRLAVQPGVVHVVREDHHRAAGRDAVEVIRARPAPVGQRRVVPRLGDDPVAVRARGGESVDRRADLAEGRGRAELHGLLVRPEPKVVVRVDEARQDRTALRIDLLGARSGRVANVSVVTDRGDASVADRQRLGLWSIGIDGPHLRVADQQVHRSPS